MSTFFRPEPIQELVYDYNILVLISWMVSSSGPAHILLHSEVYSEVHTTHVLEFVPRRDPPYMPGHLMMLQSTAAAERFLGQTPLFPDEM